MWHIYGVQAPRVITFFLVVCFFTVKYYKPDNPDGGIEYFVVKWSSLGGSGFAIAIYLLTLLMEFHHPSLKSYTMYIGEYICMCACRVSALRLMCLGAVWALINMMKRGNLHYLTLP